MKLNSIKFEISILYSLILGVILVIFSLVLFIIFDSIYTEFAHDLQLKARGIHQTVQAYNDVFNQEADSLKTAVERTISLKRESPLKVKSSRISKEWLKKSEELDLKDDYINFISPNGESLGHSSNLSPDLIDLFSKSAAYPKDDSDSILKKINYQNQKIWIINYPFVDRMGEQYLIQVGVTQAPITQLLQNWLYAIALSIPIILLLTNFIGRVLAERILKQVNEMTDMARKITYQDLSLKVKSKHFDEEMQHLAEAFNDMIYRLEKSFKHIEQFSFHVAHELKTPLTIIRGESELALKKERTVDEYKQTIVTTIEESVRMLKTVEDLLLLSKVDYQPGVFKMEELDFTQFFKDVFEQTKMLARPKNITIQFSVPKNIILTMKADAVHLRRLFFNLIDNALKFTPAGGQVRLKARTDGTRIIVSVSDTGPGIPEEDLPKIFERFFSGDHEAGGSGLGLSIAKSIAHVHGGDIEVESHLGQGSTFIVSLPLSSP
jgi:heavy metal sensor kinase